MRSFHFWNTQYKAIKNTLYLEFLAQITISILFTYMKI